MPEQAYGRDPHVRSRILQYLGSRGGEPPTCAWLQAQAPRPGAPVRRLALEELDGALEEGAELERSLWDHRWLVVHLDLEHVHFDEPDRAWRSPEASFALQRPVVEALEGLLLELDIAPLHLLSGRGHHFVWAVDRRHPLAERLATLGRQASPPAALPGAVEPELAASFRGLGMVAEFLGHRVLELCQGSTSVPLEITAVEVPSGPGGREVISLDLSEYGDPLHMRSIRVPFGPYLKGQRFAWSRGEEPAEEPGLVMIPLHEMGESAGLEVMRDPGAAALLARRASTEIPDRTAGTGVLLEQYLRSPLADFHRWHCSAGRGGAVEPPALPPCLESLLRPEERLLRPAGMRLVTRGLLAEGWHPRHIAELVAGRMDLLLRDRGDLPPFDPGLRADFYVRLFAGLVALGRDLLGDFDCSSYRELGYCAWRECPELLGDLARTLRERREHGWPLCLSVPR